MKTPGPGEGVYERGTPSNLGQFTLHTHKITPSLLKLLYQRLLKLTVQHNLLELFVSWLGRPQGAKKASSVLLKFSMRTLNFSFHFNNRNMFTFRNERLPICIFRKPSHHCVLPHKPRGCL